MSERDGWWWWVERGHVIAGNWIEVESLGLEPGPVIGLGATPRAV